MNRFRDTVDVIRIDDARISQLVGRSRELAQDQYAILIPSARDELFRHKVHPIANRRDEHDVRRAI